jgi:hypothetical protein
VGDLAGEDDAAEVATLGTLQRLDLDAQPHLSSPPIEIDLPVGDLVLGEDASRRIRQALETRRLEHVLQRSTARIPLETQPVAGRTVGGAHHTPGVDGDRSGVELIHHRLENHVGVVQVAQQAFVLDGQLVVVDGALHHLFEIRGLPGLGDVGVDVAIVDRADDGVHVGEAGQDDAGGGRLHLEDPGEELDTGHLRHPLVRDHHRHRPLPLEEVERLGGGGGGEDLVFVLEGVGHRLEDRLLVVDDQDPAAFRAGHGWRRR